MELMETSKLNRVKKLIYVLSAIIPVAVAILFGVKIEGVDLSFLPPFYATINGVTAIVLVLALVAIKRKNKILHQRLIQFGFIFSCVCCLSYDF